MGFELAIQGIAEIFGWSNDIPTQAVGSGITLFLSAWQAKNAQQFVTRVKFKYEMEHLDQRKLDRTFPYSDAFKEFVIQVVKNVSETASEVKQEAFVQLTMNTLQGSLETFKDKHLLRRLLDQISESEIAALVELAKLEKEHEAITNISSERFYRAESDLHLRLGWSIEDTAIALSGLRQLGLAVVEGMIPIPFPGVIRQKWTTPLAFRLIQAIQNQNLSDD
jgi:hypothetical protein